MTVQDVIDHFGSPTQLAQKLGLNVKNVYIWRRKGHVTPNQAVAIERITNGKFKASALAK